MKKYDIEEIKKQKGAHNLDDRDPDFQEKLKRLPSVGFKNDKDYQAGKLYAWQHASLSKANSKEPLTAENAKNFVALNIDHLHGKYGWYWPDKFEIIERPEGHCPAAAFALNEETGLIENTYLLLPPHGRTESLLMHEMCHIFAGPEKLHGPEYAGYLMYGMAYGLAMNRMMLGFYEVTAERYGVEWKYPQS